MIKKKINGQDYLVYEKNAKYTVSRLAIKMMERNEIHGLLPFKNVQQDGEFRYTLESEEMLSCWLEKVHSKKHIINMIEDLLITADELETYLLLQNHLCMDGKFISVYRNQCRFVYVPEEEYMQKSILDLIRDILFTTKYAMNEDFFYLFNLQNAFSRGDIRSLRDVRKWLNIINGIETEENEDEESEVYKGTKEKRLQETNKQRIDIQAEQKSFLEEVNPDFVIENMKLKRKEKKSFFRKKEKLKREKEEISNKKDLDKSYNNKIKPYIINNLNREDATFLLGSEAKDLLIRIKTGEEYVLSQGSYILGKDERVNIIIQDNQTISRQHARIFFEGGFHFIEDLGSTNGTFVNGQILKCNEPYKLENMSRIVLSDEEFIYEMER